MKIEQALKEFQSKNRKMGCVSAVNWFCKRVSGFHPKRLIRIIETGPFKGEKYHHVVATNGKMDIDVAPYADKPSFSNIRYKK